MRDALTGRSGPSGRRSGRRSLRIATRGSELARWQARFVGDHLIEAGAVEAYDLVTVRTEGDRDQASRLSSMSGRGVFAKDVQAAVLAGLADIAVHSAKDLPAGGSAPGMVIAAVPARGDVRDALVGAPLSGLRPGAPVATGAPRRRAQLSWLRPDLTFCDVRGNITTRLGRTPSGGALVVAFAALERLGLLGEVAEALDPRSFVPQVGQGALAVECREGDEATRSKVWAIDDPPSHESLLAERGFLAALGGGCNVPAGAWARHIPAGAATVLRMDVMLASLDGQQLVRYGDSAHDSEGAESFGMRLAASLVLEHGGSFLMTPSSSGSLFSPQRELDL